MPPAGAAVTLVFLIVAGFVAVAERYGPLVAALALGGLFLLVTILAAICCVASRRQTAAELICGDNLLDKGTAIGRPFFIFASNRM